MSFIAFISRAAEAKDIITSMIVQPTYDDDDKTLPPT